MKAFTNTPITKERFIHHLKWHQDQDKIMSGRYGDNDENQEEFHGCAVGCSLNTVRLETGNFDINVSDHGLYEKYLGVPEWLAHLEDTLFESLSEERQEQWPLEFGQAINVGSDLNKIKHPFLILVMEKNLKTLGSLEYDKDRFKEVALSVEMTKEAIELTIEYHKNPSELLKFAARSAARSAYFAADSAYSARSAYSAAYSAHSAHSAARFAAYSATIYEEFADNIIELMKGCK